MRSLTASLTLLLAATATAQTPVSLFQSSARSYLPDSSVATAAALLADLDGDGDLDAVFGNIGLNGNGEPDRLLLNQGHGEFRDAPSSALPLHGVITQALAAGDLDGDGDLDLVLGVFGQNRLYLNDGSGGFSDATATHLPAEATATNSLALGDIDGDGDLDLATAEGELNTHTALRNRLYLNDGSGRFSDQTAARLPVALDESRGVALADVDGDGDLDLVVANQPTSFFRNDGRNFLYLNDSGGRFTASPLPALLEDSAAVTAVDVEGDGDLDLVFANEQQPNSLYLNTGGGAFVDATAGRMPAAIGLRSLAAADHDGDGDVDLFFGSPAQNLLFLNDGTGTFTDVTPSHVPVDIDPTRAVAAGDVDGNGRPDLLIGNARSAFRRFTRNQLYLNAGDGGFFSATPHELPPAVGDTRGLAVGDTNGDANLDLYLANYTHPNRLLLGDGNGGFSDATATALPPDVGPSEDAVMVDIDLDGDLDVVVATGRHFNNQNRLYLNGGSGIFRDETMSRLPQNADESLAVAAGDVDGDGDPDLLFANGGNFNNSNRLYLNDGLGMFSDATGGRLPGLSTRTQDVLLFDLEGDGDLDVFFSDIDANQILENDGLGFFRDVTAARYPQTIQVQYRSGFSALAGDADGDGDIDLVMISHAIRNDVLFANDGRGFFQEVPGAVPASLLGSLHGALGDVDEDGDLDLVFDKNGPALYLNDGRGIFADATARTMPLDPYPIRDFVLADLDRDGDLDLALGRTTAVGIRDQDGLSRVLLNHHRQISASRFARPGQPYTLHFDVEPGYGAGSELAAPFFHTAAAIPRIPLGSLGEFALAPTGIIALPALAVPTANGRASAVFAIPTDPLLLGADLLTQAIVVHAAAPATWRLSNLQADRIR